MSKYGITVFSIVYPAWIVEYAEKNSQSNFRYQKSTEKVPIWYN